MFYICLIIIIVKTKQKSIEDKNFSAYANRCETCKGMRGNIAVNPLFLRLSGDFAEAL